MTICVKYHTYNQRLFAVTTCILCLWRDCIHRTAFRQLKYLDLAASHWLVCCSTGNIRGAFKKFCNSVWCTNDTSKIFMLLFNIITFNTNAYVTFIKHLFDASQIEFLLHAVRVWLRGLFDLIIIFEPCSCSAGCSNEHWIGIVVIPTLLNRPSTQWLRSISSSEEVVPRWQWDQAGHWVLSRIWTAGHHNSIWPA